MVTIRPDITSVTFVIRGWHKVWALRDSIFVRHDQLREVRHDPGATAGWKGWRLPGTHVPGLITAGQYRRAGEWVFYDVVDPAQAIVVELVGHHFARLIVEVDDVEHALATLRLADVER